jgi:alkaline phosphatase D
MQPLVVFRRALLWVSLCVISVPAAGQVVLSLPAANETDWHSSSFWETVDGEPPELSWEFSDSQVRLINPRGGRGSLISGPLPANFELSWQWRIETKANTGLKYRVRQFGNRLLGVEYQIIDDSVDTPAKGSTASIYDLVAPSADARPRPAGQWNDARVVATGNRLEHYLNGSLVAWTVTAGPSWDHQIALSKFYGEPRFGKPSQGDRFMLTDHGGKADFRNFQFVARDVVESTDVAETSGGPFLGNAIRNSWADQDSIVLWTRTTALADMITDGPHFLPLSKSDASQLSKISDPDELHRAQLPEGAKISEMIGACPGAAGEVRLTYFPKLGRKSQVTSPWRTTRADQDFTAQWQLDGLKPDTEYAAVVEARPVGGGELTAVIRGGFRTAPRAAQAEDLSFCVTTCHDFLRRDDGLAGHKIYPTMSKMNPDFVVHAGDIEYYDKPDPWAMTIELMRYKWGRIFALPSNRSFYQQTTSYFLKDDHDTLKNDCWVGQTYGSVTFEQGVRLFNEEQFPSRDPRYQTVRWGRDLQIWLLEGRDYRSPNNAPDGPGKTILGQQQKSWLLQTLEQSDARFKLIFSPTPIVGPDRANKKDNHANDVFAHEGRELRDELAKHPGVIVFCGDRHWQYASVDSETGLWEFGCGPGSEKHGLGWKPGDERPTHQFLRVAGGFLSGQLKADGDANVSTLTIRHHKVDGEQVSEFAFPIAADPITAENASE